MGWWGGGGEAREVGGGAGLNAFTTGILTLASNDTNL